MSSDKMLTRGQAIAALQKLGPAACSYWADIDHPREMLASFDASFMSGPPEFYEGAEIVRAYARHLAAPAQSSCGCNGPERLNIFGHHAPGSVGCERAVRAS